MSELKPCPQEAEVLDIIESMLDVADMKCTGPLYADDPPRSGMCRIPEDDAAKLRHYIANRRAQAANKEKGEYAMDTESKRIFDALYALHDHYDEDPRHMICAEAADYIKSLSEMLTRSAAPENEPLTLEQLREMRREPVWVVDGNVHCWMIVERADNLLMHFAEKEDCGVGLPFTGYGKTWFAYARKPERSES